MVRFLVLVGIPILGLGFFAVNGASLERFADISFSISIESGEVLFFIRVQCIEWELLP